ncbi:uncharacterized protein LOC132161898 [Corylus avellana]|uniref:uncharacterized protein LOC132161898 n=1 Tax=Corylus avellana TaxID=13451 RepID=UPI00286A615A|nr:uncharacterized protein LOC132161898 [Corylus avellana]
MGKVGEPQAQKVLRLMDGPKEPEVPQLKRRKVAKQLGPEAHADKGKPSFAQLLAAKRKAGPGPIVCPVEAYKALLNGKPVAAKPLAVAPLINLTGVAPTTTIHVDLGLNIQHILEDIAQESELESSVGMERNNVGVNSAAAEEGARSQTIVQTPTLEGNRQTEGPEANAASSSGSLVRPSEVD